MSEPAEPSGSRPGELTAQDRVELVAQLPEARRVRDWTQLAGSLVRARSRGVRVAVLSRVLGVNAERVRAICRDRGSDPAAVADALAEAGWVNTPAAAAGLGAPVGRLLAHRSDGERDGVAEMAGCGTARPCPSGGPSAGWSCAPPSRSWPRAGAPGSGHWSRPARPCPARPTRSGSARRSRTGT